MDRRPHIREIRQVVKKCPVEQIPEISCFVWELKIEEVSHVTNEVNRHFDYEITFGTTAENSRTLGRWPDFDWDVIKKLVEQENEMNAWIGLHRRGRTTRPLLRVIQGGKRHGDARDTEIDLDVER